MKKMFIVFAFSLQSLWSIGQDTIHLNKISNELGLEKFENKYTFSVDTFLRTQNYSFYAITPWSTSFSNLFVFDKRNNLVETSDFLFSLNHISFSLRALEVGEKTYLMTYYLGGGTRSTSLSMQLYEISDIIKLVYQDVVLNYLQDLTEVEEKQEILQELNSYHINIKQDELFIEKRINDPGTALMLIGEILKDIKIEKKEILLKTIKL